jgi:hypothetical protein
MSDRAGCADRRQASVTARRSHLVFALITVALASLAHAPSAVAQLRELGEVEAIVADATPVPVPAQASQLADQAASVAQAAVADAAAIQEQPTNVSVPAVVASPGAEAVVEQENTTAAVADAKNTGAVAQELDQSQVGGGGAAPSGGGQSQAQAGAQGAQTTQAAAAQAVAVQNHPINIAIPIIVNSPNSQSVVVQANSVAAAAGAANETSTTQTGNQAQLGSGPDGGRTADPGAPALPGSHTTEPPGGGSLPGVAQEALSGLTAQPGSVWIWVWNWNWTWNVPNVSVPALAGGIISPADIDIPPSLIDLVSAVDAAVLPELAGLVGAPSNASGQDAAKRRPDPGARERGGTGRLLGVPWGSESARAASTLPSNFVQTPANDAKAQDRRVQTADPSLPLPLPKHSVPAGSGGASVSPFGFVLGALLLLLFQLAAAAFALSRRFDLASAAWRRQAYLSPLERPG